jgi:hypothetical protein
MKIYYPVRKVEERHSEVLALFNDLIRKLTFVQAVSLSDEPLARFSNHHEELSGNLEEQDREQGRPGTDSSPSEKRSSTSTSPRPDTGSSVPSIASGDSSRAPRHGV